VFAAFGPAVQAAGTGLLIAAVIAYCNAVASAQLAAVYPTSGGTYISRRERLGPWWDSSLSKARDRNPKHATVSQRHRRRRG
jgi:amino acid transporter